MTLEERYEAYLYGQSRSQHEGMHPSDVEDVPMTLEEFAEAEAEMNQPSCGCGAPATHDHDGSHPCCGGSMCCNTRNI